MHLEPAFAVSCIGGVVVDAADVVVDVAVVDELVVVEVEVAVNRS